MDGRINLPVGQHAGKRSRQYSGTRSSRSSRSSRCCLAAIALALGLCAGTVFGEAATQPAAPVATSRPASIAAVVVDTPAARAPSPASQPAPAAEKPAPEKPVAEAPAPTPIEATPIHYTATHAEKENAENAQLPQPSASKLPSGLSNTLQVGAALAVVIGLILIGKGFAKKYLPQAKASNGKGVIEVLARYPLSKNQSLVLVRIGSQIVTLNQGKEQSQSVLVVNDPAEVAKIMGQIEGQNPRSIQAGFSKLLANAQVDLEDPANDPDRDQFEESSDPDSLDNQLEEMAAARRQLMELRQQVRSVRDSLAD